MESGGRGNNEMGNGVACMCVFVGGGEFNDSNYIGVVCVGGGDFLKRRGDFRCITIV